MPTLSITLIQKIGQDFFGPDKPILLWKYEYYEINGCFVFLKDFNGNGRVVELTRKRNVIKDLHFTDIKILWRYDPDYREDSKPACFAILKELNGNGRIVDLFSESDVLKDFKFKNYNGCAYNYKDIYPSLNSEKTDTILRFLDRAKKKFALYSIKENKYIFSYDYTDIDVYSKGVLLDEKIAVEYKGFIKDFSEYEFDGRMFYNIEKNDYWVIIDETERNGSFIDPFEQDKYNEDILKLDTNYFSYTYNKKTEELQRKEYQDEDIDWSEYADIAYEGYSRLYLGLED